MDMSMLPTHMREGVRDYVLHGREPGGFLRAVLENDLVEAFARADSINSALMSEWATFLYNEMPYEAWGSPEKVEKWIEARREERWKAVTSAASTPQ